MHHSIPDTTRVQFAFLDKMVFTIEGFGQFLHMAKSQVYSAEGNCMLEVQNILEGK